VGVFETWSYQPSDQVDLKKSSFARYDSAEKSRRQSSNGTERPLLSFSVVAHRGNISKNWKSAESDNHFLEPLQSLDHCI
jgi:hypothetical protein